MCKIFAICGLNTTDKRAKAWELVKAIAPIMSTSDNHGIGYAAMSEDGTIVHEKWLNNKDFMKVRRVYSEDDALISAELGDAVDVEQNYASGGDRTEDVYAIILHTRFATCAKSIENTHPFVKLNTALIHNGIINNHHELTKFTSTCDSEVILNSYLENSGNVQKVADEITGYYACAVIDSSGILDIFKSRQAKLTVSHNKAIGSLVFCTDGTMLAQASSKVKQKTSKPVNVNPGHRIRFDATTGKVIDVVAFKEKEEVYTSYPAKSNREMFPDTKSPYWSANRS